MEELMVNVNWTAVIAGAVIAFFAGWLWYSDKMFAKGWRAGVGVSEDDASSMAPAMLTQMVSTFLLAWVIGITETTNSLMFSILIVLTLSATIKANGLFCQKSHYAIAVEAGYILIMAAIMIGAHVAL